MRLLNASLGVLFLCLPGILLGQLCPHAPVGPAPDPSEAHLTIDFNQSVLDASECQAKAEIGCANRAKDILALDADLLQLVAFDAQCSKIGVDALGAALPAADKKYYADRFTFWNGLYSDMSLHSTQQTDGTYQIPLRYQQSVLNLVLAPAVPAIVGSLSANTTKFSVTGQSIDTNYTNSKLYVCVWKSDPDPKASLNCLAGSAVTPASLVLTPPVAPGMLPYITLDSTGNASITLKTPLTTGQFVSLVQVSTPSVAAPPPAAAAVTVTSTKSYGVTAQSQCNQDPVGNPYSDCDLLFSIIGGVEQSGLSSEPSSTDGFLRVYSQSEPIVFGKGQIARLATWGVIRLLSAPQQNSTSGVVSAFTNPSGTIQTNTISSVGSSIDYTVGLAFLAKSHGRGTTSLLAGFGGTTPLTSNTVAQAFVAPPFGTVECNILYNKFASNFAAPSYNILLGKANQATPTYPATTASACLLNGNSTTTSTAGVTTYSPITTVAFSNQDRHDFLAKWEVGVRGIYHFTQPGMLACGDLDASKKIAPCQRGMIDFTFGQDASITRGQIRNWVVKVDGVQPVPIKGEAFLYLFGSFSMRVVQNVNDTPLILQAGNTATISGTGSTAIPNVNTVVLPLVQPDRDFYRFGVGLDITCLLSKVFSSNQPCSLSSQPPSTGANSGS